MTSRRDLLEAAAAAAAAGILGVGPVRADSPASDDDIDRLLPSLSNWGRWGPDDQLGTLNFVTPGMRVAAARSIATGRTVSLAHERAVNDPEGVRKFRYQNFHYTDPQPEEAGTIDEIGAIYHGYTITHLDALCHLFTPGGRDGMYNGYPISLVTDAGAQKLGVERMGEHGIAGRGVLLDLAPGGALPLGSVIRAADLAAAEARQRVSVGTGDVLFVRNGGGASNSYQLGTGMHPDCLPWLHSREIAALGHDGDGDVHPPQPGLARWTEPVHMIAIPYLGLPLICGCDLEAIAAACAEENRWSFFVSLAPWRFKGATSSPVNPLAIF
ncbi:MAG: cyclase family protein [Amaricoccus sp.]